MDVHDTEEALEEELEKVSVNLSDMGSDSDTDIEEDFSASDEKLQNDLPAPVLAYFQASRNRLNAFEQLILEDIEDIESMCNEIFSPSQHADLPNELGFDFGEDPLKLKERIMSEIEEEVDTPCESHDSTIDYDTEYDTHKNSERQLMLEWRQLEESLRKEEEQRLAELEAEREQCLNSAREEEERKKRRTEQFREELRRTEITNQFEYLQPEGDGEINQSFQLEIIKQQEIIQKLEEQIAEERRVFEEVQQEEARRSEARCTTAVTKLQAAFRGILVRRWSKQALIKKREEERIKEEERKERERKWEREEQMKMERERERKKLELEEQRRREEAERRRAEYERAKEQERHRLERERKLEEQKRKEKEEAKRKEDERKRKELEKQKREEERNVVEERRKVQEVDAKRKEEEKQKTKRIKNEIKRSDEVESPDGIEEWRLDEERRKVKKVEKHGQENIIVDKITMTDEEKWLERLENKTVEEVTRKVQEDEEKTRKAEEKANRIECERKRKDREKQKVMELKTLQEERKRKDVEEANMVEDELKRQEKEKQKVMEIRKVEKEKKVQVEQEEKERKTVKETKRTMDKRTAIEEENQKLMEERRVEEEKKKKEMEEKIKRKEEKRLNGNIVIQELGLKPKEQVKHNETEKEQTKRMEKNMKEEDILMLRTDKQNMGGRKLNKPSVNGLVDQTENPKTDKESMNTTKSGNVETVDNNISQLCLSQSMDTFKIVLGKPLCSRNEQDEQPGCQISTLYTLCPDQSSVALSPFAEKSQIDTRELQCALDDSNSACLPESTEQKRLDWMMNCTPWTKLSMQNKRKVLSAPPKRRGHRKTSEHKLLPLPVDTILRSGPWSSLKQVTSVALEDLSSCSLSTLSECNKLRSLTLRRCNLQAVDGLNHCTELQHIDLQENNITYIDCGGLRRLEVLLLGRNRLMSIHGLDDAVNLTVLQLSHNVISRISGLGSLKKLHRLTVDHNQLISTKGLSEAFTLLHLDCSYNHLSHVEGLENCALLNMLDLRGNNLTELPMLENHVLLRELYLDDNSICSLHGLDSCWLPLLRCLSVSQNSITQLPLLQDLLSLKTLNVSHNCLSELRNICMSLQGCTHLQELSITDNPVKQENNWRSSVLAVNPSLIKLNGEQSIASGKLSADSTQLWSFQALCQAHQDQIDTVLQRHSTEISSATSSLHSQLLVGNHAAELFQLAEEQRYAHEYGDNYVCETAIQESVATSRLKELSEWDLTHRKSGEVKTEQPAEHTTLDRRTPLVPCFTPKIQPPSGDHNPDCPGSCEGRPQKYNNTQPNEDGSRRYVFPASRMNLKTLAVMVIQRRWREHRQRRRMGPLEPPAKALARSRPQKEVKSCKTRPECLNKDDAATVIQAVWRGFALRKRLTRVLMLAQISGGDESFEEVDMDEFIFDEEAMERDWITLHPDMSSSSVPSCSEQLPLPKLVLPSAEVRKSASVQPWNPRQAWISDEEAQVPAQSQSPDTSISLQSSMPTLENPHLSERCEKILEEWGFSSASTALLMLKRAQRMTNRKQQHHRKFQVGSGDVSVQEALRREPELTQTQTQTRHRTYQWLQTQAMPSRRSSAPSVSDHFLPEIDPEILNGGRVQLVSSIGYREAGDSDMRQGIAGSGFTTPRNQHAHTRTYSPGHAKKEVPSPQRVTLAPSRKERISFRDNPVQLSGGWGGGKKRSKANKLK